MKKSEKPVQVWEFTFKVVGEGADYEEAKDAALAYLEEAAGRRSLDETNSKLIQ